VVEAAKANGNTSRFTIYVSLLEIYLEQVSYKLQVRVDRQPSR